MLNVYFLISFDLQIFFLCWDYSEFLRIKILAQKKPRGYIKVGYKILDPSERNMHCDVLVLG